MILQINEKKNFILNFEEDGEDYPVPNTKENKDNLLKAMEEQIDNAWRYEAKKKKDKKVLVIG